MKRLLGFWHSFQSSRAFWLATAAGVVGVAYGTAAIAEQVENGLHLPIPIAVRAFGAPADDYPEGQACRSGIAIQIEFGSLCSQTCKVHKDCPADWGCKTIPQGDGSQIGICFPRRVGVPQS